MKLHRDGRDGRGKCGPDAGCGADSDQLYLARILLVHPGKGRENVLHTQLVVGAIERVEMLAGMVAGIEDFNDQGRSSGRGVLCRTADDEGGRALPLNELVRAA